MTGLRIAAIFWALLLAGVARADTADSAVRYFCGPGHEDLAPLIRSEARHHMGRPSQLVAVMAAESHCRPDAVNVTTGALGLFQIMPGRSADPDHLDAGELLDPTTNVHLGVRHLSRLLTLCGSFAGAIHLNHSKDGKCRNWRTDKLVGEILRKERAFWRWLRTQGRVS
jgi:hypothetical protein